MHDVWASADASKCFGCLPTPTSADPRHSRLPLTVSATRKTERFRRDKLVAVAGRQPVTKSVTRRTSDEMEAIAMQVRGDLKRAR